MIEPSRGGRRNISTSEMDSEIDDPRVVPAVQEFLTMLESGKSPSRGEFLIRYPEIAKELGKCLDGLELVHKATRDIEPAGNLRPNEVDADPIRHPLGDFRILREIGRGGMGIVYEATQLSLGRRVAVKVLPFAASLDPTRLQRFKNEAQAAAQLHHSNIVPVYAVGADRGVHYYAMQLIEGNALSELIAHLRQVVGKSPLPESGGIATTADREVMLSQLRHPQDRSKRPQTPKSKSAQPAAEIPTELTTATSTVLSTSQRDPATYFRTVVRLIHQAASALEHAHRFGVIHRDIKPANLILDHHGHLWITDFGLAQFQADVPLTRTGDMLGTLRYMSPEQVSGDRVVLDHRADIYSLGVTMYELLTLEPAFVGNDRQILLRRIMEDEPRALRAIDKSVPIELETIVLKAIAKVPADRYSTAQQFADDMQRWLDDKPILARRPTFREHFARWRRRHRSAMRFAVLLLFLATLGLTASSLVILREHSKTKSAYRREYDQRVAAEKSFQQARQAVDAFTLLGEEELAFKPSLQPLRRRFLETSLEYYKTFLEQRHDDPTLRAELAATSDRVAKLIDELSVLENLAPLMLLSDDHVQQELHISESEQDQIDEIMGELPTESDNDIDIESDDALQLTQIKFTGLLRSRSEKVAALLGPERIERLRQIDWQQRGPFAFKSSEVVAALDLTSEQRKQISAIIEENRMTDGDPPGPPPHGDFHGLPGDFDDHPPHKRFDDDHRRPGGRGPGDHGPGGRDGHGPGPGLHGGPQHMRETMERTVKQILEVLTPEQRSKWKQLIGEPFAYELHLRPDEWLPMPPPKHPLDDAINK